MLPTYFLQLKGICLTQFSAIVTYLLAFLRVNVLNLAFKTAIPLSFIIKDLLLIETVHTGIERAYSYH